MLAHRTTVALVAMACGVLTAAHASADTSVHTSAGWISAAPASLQGVRAYKGIPYAAPPIGALRWRPPEPPASWRGTRAGSRFGPKCPQTDDRPAAVDAQPKSEDCLYLNVWTPATSEREQLPVMVWVHGGAYVAGSGARYLGWSDGAPLASKGVVLVTLNYRLGVLGFMAHPELTAESTHHSSGNYALLDVIAALRWVKRNIARFGGDAGNVTIFGQSAGAETVSILLASPLAAGLFDRAISQSGGSMGFRQPRPLGDVERDGVAFGRALSAPSLAALRALSAEALVGASGSRFEPVLDGWVYPVDLHDVLSQGRQHDVPLLVGSNGDEGQIAPALTAEAWKADVSRRYGRFAAAVLARYPADSDAMARVSKKVSDTVQADLIASTIVSLAARTGNSKVFQYRFEHAPPSSPYAFGRTGAYHAAEIPYVFNSLDSQERGWTDVDRELERTLSSYWVNFARSGDPNGMGLPVWTDVRRQPRSLLLIDDRAQMREVSVPDVDFFDAAYYGPDGVFRQARSAGTAAPPARARDAGQ